MATICFLICYSNQADVTTIYEYITKVFPYYNRLEKSAPMLKTAIETELAKRAGFVKTTDAAGLWSIDPDWDGKQPSPPKAVSEKGYVWEAGKFNCEHCPLTTPFEVAAVQHVASFHPDKVKPTRVTDTQLRKEHGIQGSIQVKLVQVRFHSFKPKVQDYFLNTFHAFKMSEKLVFGQKKP